MMASRAGGGSIKSTSINGVKYYSLSGQRSTAPWVDPKKLKSLRKDKDYRQRVDLIQDLKFETSTTRVKVTPDGEYVIASGVYPPQVKVFELRDLALKLERHLVSEVVNFEVLTDDYSKIAFLCADRSVLLHAKYGSHYSLRIPRMGRDVTYDTWSCDLLCAASSSELYRINLEQGRFLAPISTQSPAINVVRRSTFHGLVACGGEDGAVECVDPRKRSSIGRIDACITAGDDDQEVTSLQFDNVHGYFMAVGTSAGKVLLYDLRMSDPVRIKDHMYGSPIIDIKWHQTLNSVEPKLISSDNHTVRIWDPQTGDNMTSIEPSGGTINDLCVFRESGLMLLGLDNGHIPSFFIPALGPAPKWCSYLENLTEEMEEGTEATICDDYKFLTMEDIERLNLTNLIGTNLLVANMHGYFIDYRLYKKAQSLANPFAYEEYREKIKQEKIEAERASRITIKRKLPKVNRKLAALLLERDEMEGELNDDDGSIVKRKSSKKKGLGSDILEDPRFKAMFEREEFEIDEESAEFRALNPLPTKRAASLVEEHFQPVAEEDDGTSNFDLASGSESEEEIEGRNAGRNLKRPRLYEVKDERHAEAFWSSASLAKEDALPLGERVAALEEARPPGLSNRVKFGPGGSREITFMASRRKAAPREDKEPPAGKRRGIQPLNLKPDRSGFPGRGGRSGRSRGGGGRGGGRRGGGRGKSSRR